MDSATKEVDNSNDVLPEELALLEEEERILGATLKSLELQCLEKARRLTAEDQRSRELTAELVAANRDEDKQMLASDEAVSHALKQNHSERVKSLAKLLKRPYFARFVIEEEDERRGSTTIQHDYRLGYSANPECRIIDWRKSPLAKIYYEYQEGDEFCEEVQGREREGRLVLKHPIRIDNGALKSVTTRHGTFTLQDGVWCRSGGSQAGGSGGIKSVLPLITAEQFKTITEDARTAVLIQGIAGSGKTTVALHRLAWLLHESNSDFTADECAVIVRNEVLAEFIKMTLQAIEISEVPVYTFEQWRNKVIGSLAPDTRLLDQGDAQPRLPGGFATLLHSEELFEVFEKTLKQPIDAVPSASATGLFFESLTRAVLTAASQQEKLFQITGADTNEILHYLQEAKNLEALPAILGNTYLRFLLHRELSRAPNEELAAPIRFRHLVVDELQDYSLMSLASLMNAVESAHDLTLVGDIGQSISSDEQFIGWERLKEVWQIELGERATFFTLNVSYRSTLPIMQLASYASKRRSPTEGRAGRTPIWFHCENEERATESALQWLSKALERYPTSLSA
ncbi:MAG: UvrD-helicase domain-containing protein, partial [Bdellovibrionota bacterium]